MRQARYVVAGCRPWNRVVFDQVISKYPGEWQFVSAPGELTAEALETFGPRYVFFLHWTWKVPPAITSAFECVCFHMTDVPYGRGGSPLQHLILAGHTATKLSALRMTDELDAGPVYLKDDLSLEGRAQDIYERASWLAARQILRILTETPVPQPQSGTPVVFRRRHPQDSAIPPEDSPARLYDFIRMLDADGYPHAYHEHGGLRYEYRNAALHVSESGGTVVTASVTVSPIPSGRL